MSKRTQTAIGAAAGLALGAMLAAAPAAAMTNMRHGHHMHMAHHMTHSMGHRMGRRMAYRPLTVAGPAVQAAPAYNPFGGPAPIITGPNAVAGGFVDVPFRALGTIFPYQGNIAQNPLILIGAPLHAVGQMAQLPFYIVGRTFGGGYYTTYPY